MSSEYWKMPCITIRISYYKPMRGGIGPNDDDLRRVVLDNYIEFERVKNWIAGVQKVDGKIVAETILCEGWKCRSCGREFIDYEGMDDLSVHAEKHAYGIEDR